MPRKIAASWAKAPKKQHMLWFYDEDWEDIKNTANESNMSISEFMAEVRS